MKIESGLSLREFAKGRSQPEIAELFGITQSAVSQMMRSSRDIRIFAGEEGEIAAMELRPIGSRRKQNAA
jgi:predicted transcriptional regulator